MRIAMFGGTFNPPHEGHVSAARACIAALGLDLLLVVPDREPPHKVLPLGSPTPAQRLEMCRLAFESVPHCEISELELRRGGPSYTVDTLRQLKREYPSAELWLLVGTDMFLSLDRWYCPAEITRMARLAVAARTMRDRTAVYDKAKELGRTLGAKVDIIDNPVVEISSTELRGGTSRHRLSPKVAEYIRKNQLYTVQLSELRERVREWMPPRRLAHTLGCERLCAELAKIYGADEYTVRAAALLHDYTKPLSDTEQLKLCGEWGIITDYPHDSFNDLIHADTAAEAARREFHMPEAVCRAIARHTTGASDMTVEEQIVYISDLCEETRTYDGAAELRELAKRDLSAALIAAMERSVAFVRQKGKEPYYVTLQALERLIKGGYEQ